jgi:hypothetical protein
MLQWLRNLLATKPEPATPTELIAAFIELQEEWRSFLEQQARVTRRAAKRLRDDGNAPPPPAEPLTDKRAIWQRAQELGLTQRRMARHVG